MNVCMTAKPMPLRSCSGCVVKNGSIACGMSAMPRPFVGDFNGQQRAVNACAQDNRAARALVAVHDGVRDSFGDGGLDVGNFADGWGELDGKGGNHDAREGFVFGQGEKSDFHFVVMAHACAS